MPSSSPFSQVLVLPLYSCSFRLSSTLKVNSQKGHDMVFSFTFLSFWLYGDLSTLSTLNFSGGTTNVKGDTAIFYHFTFNFYYCRLTTSLFMRTQNFSLKFSKFFAASSCSFLTSSLSLACDFFF